MLDIILIVCHSRLISGRPWRLKLILQVEVSENVIHHLLIVFLPLFTLFLFFRTKTLVPTTNPSNRPTNNPTSKPISKPTGKPSNTPTPEPSGSPMVITRKPSSASPTKTGRPTSSPTGQLEILKTHLTSIFPASYDSLDDETSDQYRAIEW